MKKLTELIADVPDFPKPGILFKDITPVLLDPDALAEVTRELAARARDLGATKIAGMESRGFLFGVPLAQDLGLGFIPLRKPGKLPRQTFRASFQKEYGEDALEMHTDACGPGDRVLIVDDLLATGGTAVAATELVGQAGADIAALFFVVELNFLKGRDLLTRWPIESLLVVD